MCIHGGRFEILNTSQRGFRLPLRIQHISPGKHYFMLCVLDSYTALSERLTDSRPTLTPVQNRCSDLPRDTPQCRDWWSNQRRGPIEVAQPTEIAPVERPIEEVSLDDLDVSGVTIEHHD